MVLLASLSICFDVEAQNVPRALPIDEPTPPRAQPVEDTPAVPARPAVPAPATPVGPDETLYEYATLCFAQKDYAIAIKPLSDYVRLYPNGRHAAEAWFRLGECNHEIGDQSQAAQAYQQVLKLYPKSDSAAGAAYRLGAYAYNARDYVKAGDYFSTCSQVTKNEAVKLPALYNSAISYEQGGANEKAIDAYKSVAAIKTANKYRESALLKIANAALEKDQKDEALTAFLDLIDITKDQEILGDALLRSGLILNEQGKAEEATANFKRALNIRAVPEQQRGMALFGIIQSSYLKKDYEAVISTYTSNATTLPPGDVHAKMLLLVGNAQKHQQRYRQAIDTFELLEKNYADAPEAIDAGYQKLLSYYQLGDTEIAEHTLQFEARYRPANSGHEYLTMSRLIRADWWFGKGDYGKAAEAFSALNMAQVPEKVLASVLYKKGFTETEAGKNTKAVSSLGSFLSKFPEDANVPAALTQRGIANKNLRNFDKALEDLAVVINKHAGHPALELALYQSGFIKGETRDYKGMIADYEKLLEKFPKTAAASEVYFAIGRGYFNLNNKEAFSKALPPLRKSIELDRESYLDKASQLLISCQWLREDVDGMAKEVDSYLEARKGARVNPQGLIFLGVNYYQRNNFEASNRYFTLAITPENAETTEAPVWNYLGMARNETGHYEAAVQAFDYYLDKTPEGEGRVRGLYGKARALLGIGKFEEAQKCTGDALSLIKTGKLKGQLQILDGDIYAARGDALAKGGDLKKSKDQWGKALAQYLVVSQFFVDPEITPESAWKAADMFERTDDEKQAVAMRKQLKTKYPDFSLKAPPAAREMELLKPAPSPEAVAVEGEVEKEEDEGEGKKMDGEVPAANVDAIPKAEPVMDDEGDEPVPASTGDGDRDV